MKVEQLKLYNKYKEINEPDRELIYIGNGNKDYYCFLYKDENDYTYLLSLNYYGLNPDKIINDLNLEIINEYGEKCIKGYSWFFYKKEYIEKYVKPILKDKLNNILNR
jgi:hypothetical protein